MNAAHALLAAVYEDPESDGKRLALGETLRHAGDPRGEFISLQFERARVAEGGGSFDAKLAKREAALVRKHAKEWIGKLAPVTVRDSLVFEKGFLAAAIFQLKKLSDGEAAIGAPEWSTVRVLGRSGFRAVPSDIVVHPVMRSLVTIGVPFASVVALRFAPRNLVAPAPAGAEPRMSPPAVFDVISPVEAAPLFNGPPERPLVAIRIYREKTERFDDATAVALADARALPKLRYLRVALNGPPAMYRWLFGSRLLEQLEAVIIDLNDYSGGPHDWFGEWHAELSTMKEAPATMRFMRWGFELHLSRDDDGAFSILDVAGAEDPSFEPSHTSLSLLIAQLPKNALTALHVRGSFGDPTPLLEHLSQTQARLRESVIPR